MKNTLIWTVIVTIIYFITFTFLGIMEASTKRQFNISRGCIYKSYLSIYNPAFRLGCEITKDRTN